MRARPLTLVAVGVVLVAIEFRVGAPDLLPDVVGWALVLIGAALLSTARAAVCAALATLASAADALAPHHYKSLDPLTGQVVSDPSPGADYAEQLVYDHLTGGHLALVVGAVILGAAALVLLLRELRRRAERCGDQEAVARLAPLPLAVALVWAGPYVLRAASAAAGGKGFDPVWNGAWELSALAGIAVMLATAWILVTRSNRRWSASRREVGSPWAELMVRDQLD